MAGLEALEILSPGPLTTVQDLGRSGFGRYGVARSGAMDPFALRTGNLLVGNPEGEAVLEITLMGFRARALSPLVIAVTGGDLHPHLDANPLRMWRSHVIRKGETLSFRGLHTGCRAYLALGGGIHVPPVLESKSTNLSSGFGGFEGRALRKGDILRSGSPEPFPEGKKKGLDPGLLPSYRSPWSLRVLLGPQDEDFKREGIRIFLETPFRVTPHCDRTGIRLAGPGVQRREEVEESIISEGVVPGAIQVPGDGQPIILLGETVTGGYRKIATVIAADLPFLGQLKPGDEVRFRVVSMEGALQALRQAEGAIAAFKESVGAFPI